MNPNLWILGTAVGSLLIGLILLFASRKSSNFQTINLISWLLVALFPVLIIFSDFPSSTISGSVLGFSATGAVALFVFIWWFGTKRAMDAVHIDQVQAQNQALRDSLDKASQDKQQVGVANAPKPISETRTFAYSLRKYPKKRVVLITGNIQGVRVPTSG